MGRWGRVRIRAGGFAAPGPFVSLSTGSQSTGSRVGLALQAADAQCSGQDRQELLTQARQPVAQPSEVHLLHFQRRRGGEGQEEGGVLHPSAALAAVNTTLTAAPRP